MKEKRSILRSLKDRLRNKHNVSVAETDHQDLWQRAELAVAIVSSDRQRADQVIGRIDAMVASEPRVRVLDATTISY